MAGSFRWALLAGPLVLLSASGSYAATEPLPPEPPPGPTEPIEPIVGGEESGSYPQAAALMYATEARPQLPDGTGGAVGCSGVLIRDDVLLTAAHCAIENEPFGAYFGPDPYGTEGETVPIAGFWIHPLFDPKDEGHIWHDIALVPLHWGPQGIDPAPEFEAVVEELIGTGVWHAGFGQAGSSGPSYLRKVSVSLVTDWWFDLLITTPLDGSPCYGDSGGPAFVSAGGLPFVAGVVSFVYSSDCISGDAASTLVDGHLEWIVETAGPSSWEGPQPPLDPAPEIPQGDDDDSGGDDDDDSGGDDDDSAVADDDDDDSADQEPEPLEPDAPGVDEDESGNCSCAASPGTREGVAGLFLLCLVLCTLSRITTRRRMN